MDEGVGARNEHGRGTRVDAMLSRRTAIAWLAPAESRIDRKSALEYHPEWDGFVTQAMTKPLPQGDGCCHRLGDSLSTAGPLSGFLAIDDTVSGVGVIDVGLVGYLEENGVA